MQLPGSKPISEYAKKVKFWTCAYCGQKNDTLKHSYSCFVCGQMKNKAPRPPPPPYPPKYMRLANNQQSQPSLNQQNHGRQQSATSAKSHNNQNVSHPKLCTFCYKLKVTTLTKCGHSYCVTHLNRLVSRTMFHSEWPVQCLCKEASVDTFMIMSLPITSLAKMDMLSLDPNLVRCPKCNTPYLAEKGDPNAVDKNWSNEEREHYINNRFKCPQPNCVEFCKSCKISPYHIGSTCAEYAEANKNQCKYCDSVVQAHNVCNNGDCINKMNMVCEHQFPCGHTCIGIKNEKVHLRCLNGKCVSAQCNVTEDANCAICYEQLKTAPCIMLRCAHYFHYHCIKRKVDMKWHTPYISF